MSRGGPEVKAIFTEALDRPAGPEREAYLVEACGGDTNLLRRVEELLAAFARAGEVLGPNHLQATEIAHEPTETRDQARTTNPETTAASPPSTDPDATVGQAPDRSSQDGLAPGVSVRYFGDYEIRRELGRGGMGLVYEAHQVSLNRPVALKMVKAGLLAGDDELRRFRNEAEAVALLDHPGIVPVYEVGQHDGQHFFSMKLYSGGSLVPLLERYKDDPKAASKLVAEAAEAVAHAHARGILHRDIKPANLLVDAEGHPHVTDFGLAKKVQAEVEFTQSGAILGTPAYMSPEQATGRRGSITTATDIYGLGAVLYALLTGQAPFGGDSVVETIDAVRNAAPAPPTRLNAKVPRDLETICLKCLEKDPRRRFATAQALADDLRAWLDSRPIAARRVGAAERAWLWCKRRPAVAALSAAVLLALVGGTATVIAVQRQANRALAGKNADLTESLWREANANAELAAANGRVEQRYNLAVDAIKTFHTGVSEDFLLKQEQFKELRDRLLTSASDFYGKLSALLGKETDFASRRALALSNSELADLTDQVGKREDALAAHRAVLAAREALAAEPGADPGVHAEAAHTQIVIGRALFALSRYDEALAAFDRVRDRLEPLVRAHPKDGKLGEKLAWAHANRSMVMAAMSGRGEESRKACEEALALRERLAAEHPEVIEHREMLGISLNDQGIVLSNAGKMAEAEGYLRKALALRRTLVADNPGVKSHRDRLAESHLCLSYVLAVSARPAEAEAENRAALAIYQKLADESPAVTRFREKVATTHRSLAWTLADAGRSTEAEVDYHRAIEIYRKLAEEHPAVTSFRSSLASSLNGLAMLMADTGRPDQATSVYRESIDIARKLAEVHPEDPSFRSNLAGHRHNLAMVLADAGRPREAEAEFRAAITISARSAAENASVTLYRTYLGNHHFELARVLHDTGRPAEAEAEFRQALAIFQKLVDESPSGSDFRASLGDGHETFGRLLLQADRLWDAEHEFRSSLALFRKLVEEAPKVPSFQDGLARTEHDLSVLLRRAHKPAEALEHAQRAVAIHEEVVKEDPKTRAYRSGLAEELLSRGSIRRDVRDLAGASADFRRAIGIYESMTTRTPQEWFRCACCHAALAGQAGQAGPNASAAEAGSEADAAMALLQGAVSLGYRNYAAFRSADALAPLRGRDDFRLLIMDLELPGAPFAGGN